MPIVSKASFASDVGGTLVFDLTVERNGSYQANGLLVSNSDAFRYLAMAWKELKGEPDKKTAKPKGIRDATFSQLMKTVPKRSARV